MFRNGPLFQFHSGSPVSYQFVSTSLQNTVKFIGLNSQWYKGHGFRFGQPLRQLREDFHKLKFKNFVGGNQMLYKNIFALIPYFVSFFVLFQCSFRLLTCRPILLWFVFLMFSNCLHQSIWLVYTLIVYLSIHYSSCFIILSLYIMFSNCLHQTIDLFFTLIVCLSVQCSCFLF